MTDGGVDSAWTWTHHSYGPSASGSLYSGIYLVFQLFMN